jgi:hypothetical protein
VIVAVAEIGRTRQGEMLESGILREHQDGLQAAKVTELERRLPATDFEQADYPESPGICRYPRSCVLRQFQP